eukprot:1156667-Pelagomonas_calceolata.AAC.2
MESTIHMVTFWEGAYKASGSPEADCIMIHYRKKRKENYVGRGSSPYINQGKKGDTLQIVPATQNKMMCKVTLFNQVGKMPTEDLSKSPCGAGLVYKDIGSDDRLA